VVGLDVVSGELPDREAGGAGGFAFLADHLALARRQVVQEIVETGVAAVFPVELLGDAVQQAVAGGERFGLFPRAEGDVERGEAVGAGEVDRGLDQRRRGHGGIGGGEEAAARGGVKGTAIWSFG
jgi:hypothetical protein